jgi:hypothetical protein
LFDEQLGQVEAELEKFARTGPLAEREARAILESIPQVGAVTIPNRWLSNTLRELPDTAPSSHHTPPPLAGPQTGNCKNHHLTELSS